MRKVVGIGETILDIVFEHNAPRAAVPGGSVFNGLVSLARLGVPVRFISELGNDRAGETIRSFMTVNGIPTDHINVFPSGKSPISLAFLGTDSQADYLFYTDYPARGRLAEASFPEITENDVVLFGSYYALNPALRDRVSEFLRYAKEQNALIYYDLNFRKSHAHEAIHLIPVVIENLEFADIVRGSDEDFENLFHKTDGQQVYEQHIQFYCNRFIATHGAGGVTLFTPDGEESFPSSAINPVSTIGAGDNFNAGLIYGLLKNNVGRKELSRLSKNKWTGIIRSGIDLATEVCLGYDNYISTTFAHRYAGEHSLG